MASIEDAAECGERADALVRGLLARAVKQRRTLATAMDYVRGLSREHQGERVGAGEEGSSSRLPGIRPGQPPRPAAACSNRC